MSKYNTPDNICLALSVFITEIREYAAAIRAYDNIFQDAPHSNAFLQRSYDALWRELLSETANIFDSAGKGTNKNCTLLRLNIKCNKAKRHKAIKAFETVDLCVCVQDGSLMDLHSYRIAGFDFSESQFDNIYFITPSYFFRYSKAIGFEEYPRIA